MGTNTQNAEPKEPTWTEKLGIKNKRTRKLMEAGGEGLSLILLLYLAGYAFVILFSIALLGGCMVLFLTMALSI